MPCSHDIYFGYDATQIPSEDVVLESIGSGCLMCKPCKHHVILIHTKTGQRYVGKLSARIIANKYYQDLDRIPDAEKWKDHFAYLLNQ